MHTPLETITVELHPGGAFRLRCSQTSTAASTNRTSRFGRSCRSNCWSTAGTPRAAGSPGGEVTVTCSEQDHQTLLVQRFVGGISEDMLPMTEQGTNEQLDKLSALLAAT